MYNRTPIRAALFGIVLLLLWAVVIVAFIHWNNLHLTGFSRNNYIQRLIVVPMSKNEIAAVERDVRNASRDTSEAQRLLSRLQTGFGKDVIKARRIWSDSFLCHGPDGPAVVYALDGEGDAYIGIITVHGEATYNLEREGTFLDLTR